MHYLLFILGFIVGALGLLFFVISNTSIHEIYAAVLLLISAVLVSGAAVVESIERLRREIKSTPPK